MSPAHFKVVVYKNGSPIDGLVLERKHPATDNETITLSGHAIVRLDKDDIIEIKLEPIERDIEYTIIPGGARLNIKLEKRF
jgi:hypothetical protein